MQWLCCALKMAFHSLLYLLAFTFFVPFLDVPELRIDTQPSLVLRTLSTMCIVKERPKCQYCISDPPFVSLSPEY